MRRLRFSLFTKIIVWFFLNLLVLAAILLFIFNFRFDSRTSFFGSANRIEALTRVIESETNARTRTERDEILKKYSETYRVEFYLFDNAGKQLGGKEIALPPELFNEISRPEGAPFPPGQARPPMPPPPNGDNRPRPPSLYFTTGDPTLYWFVGRILTIEPEKAEPVRTRLIAVSDSFTGRGLFFDPTPYLLIALVIVVVSILFWLPFVRGITKNIGQMTAAAELIAEEGFNVRVDENRGDELGRLGKSINHLAARLKGFVTGQKRFLGDISHELNSPLARMQFALSILEDRVDEESLSYVADVREEVELMTKLVNELLAFSKAGIRTSEIRLENLALRPLVEMVVKRETTKENAQINLEINENLKAAAQPELLSRAVANVIRNAVRYAGKAGEINISAENGNGLVKLKIADNGAGVPENELDKLFDPFYRVQTDRARETGGSGLGLAIVKTCVESCGGKVFAHNRTPQGLEVVIQLQAEIAKNQ